MNMVSDDTYSSKRINYSTLYANDENDENENQGSSNSSSSAVIILIGDIVIQREQNSIYESFFDALKVSCFNKREH